MVMLSVADAPVSELATKSKPGAADAVLSSATLCAVEMAVKSAASEMAATAVLAVAMDVLLAPEPWNRLSMVATAAKFIGAGVLDSTLALICVTRVFTTALTAGALPAKVSTVATWAAAFCTTKASLPVAESGS